MPLSAKYLEGKNGDLVSKAVNEIVESVQLDELIPVLCFLWVTQHLSQELVIGHGDSFLVRLFHLTETSLLKMGCLLISIFICTGYIESVCTCLWYTYHQDVDDSNSEIVVLTAMIVSQSKSAPDMPVTNPNQVTGFMVQNINLIDPLCKLTWWEELLDWMGQDCSGTHLGNLEATNVTLIFQIFHQNKLVKVLSCEKWKTVVR